MSRTGDSGVDLSGSALDDTAVLPAVDVTVRAKTSFDAVSLLTVYALLLLFIPSTLIFAPLGGAGTPATVAALCITMLCITAWISDRIAPSGGGRRIRIAMLVFALAILASFVAGMTRDITEVEVLSADRGLIILAAWGGLVVMGSQFITNYQQLDKLLRRLVIAGSIISVVGILQFRGIDLTHYIQIPGLQVNSADQIVALNRNGFGRPWGTATQPIEFGVALAMLLPIALQQAFNPAYGGRLARWLPVALIAFTAPLTVSRSGILGLGAAFLVIFPTWPAQRRLSSLPVIFFGVAGIHLFVHGLIGTFIGLFKGIFNHNDSSVQSRVNDYSGVSQYVQQRPIFGRGFGTFLPELYRFTDNTYLLALVETGIVGVAALLILFITGIQCAAAGRRLTQDVHRREIGQALVASIVVAMVSSATFDLVSFPMVAGLLFLILGCAGAYRQIMLKEPSNPAPLPEPNDGIGLLLRLSTPKKM
jgi:polysaccharide biosynthesis protein PslJ